ncbi:hypothetical protein PR048_013605, partial [Dryococelus australis]
MVPTGKTNRNGDTILKPKCMKDYKAKKKGQLVEHLAVQTPFQEVVVREINKKRTHTILKPNGAGRKRRKICKGCYDLLRSTGLNSREADKKVRRVT